MCTNIIIKLSIFYVTVSIARAASIDLCVTISDNLNKNVLYSTGREAHTNRLLLRDCRSYPFTPNAVDDIRFFIVNKLELPHLEWKILQAAHTDKGLLFEMSSEEDVNEILEKSAVKLRHKNCVLKSTVKEFFG